MDLSETNFDISSFLADDLLYSNLKFDHLDDLENNYSLVFNTANKLLNHDQLPYVKNGIDVSINDVVNQYSWFGHQISNHKPLCILPLYVSPYTKNVYDAIGGDLLGVELSLPSYATVRNNYCYSNSSSLKQTSQVWNRGYSWSISSCGSNLIGDKTILTAAHCVEESNYLASLPLGNFSANYNLVNNNNLKTGSLTGNLCPNKSIWYSNFEWPVNYCLITLHPAYTKTTFGTSSLTQKGYQVYLSWGQWLFSGKENASLVSHPNYDSENIKNDIAIINSHSVIASSKTTTIPILSDNNKIVDVEDSYILGYGIVNESGGKKLELQYANVDILSDEVEKDCNNWSSDSFDILTMLCAGKTINNNVSTGCSGDSGGPLVVLTDKGYRLAGLTSFGPNTGCGTENFPTVYTRVPGFISIENNSASGWLWNSISSTKNICDNELSTLSNTYQKRKIYGSNYDDVIYNSSGASQSLLYGKDGNDVICNFSEATYLYGGNGNDTLLSSLDNSYLYGDSGSDYCSNTLLNYNCETLDSVDTYGGLFDEYTAIAASYTPASRGVFENYAGTADETDFKFSWSKTKSYTCKGRVTSGEVYFGDYQYLNIQKGNTKTKAFFTGENPCFIRTSMSDTLTTDGTTIGGTILGRTVDATCTGYFRTLSANTCSGTIDETAFSVTWNPADNTFTGSGSGAGILVAMHAHQLGTWFPTTAFVSEPENTYGGLFDEYTAIAASYTP
ncbi:MAG: trypsin-like serine protease, partial [Bacteroidota bacterium]